MKPTKRDIILSTSAKLFRERGYSATSMRDIANAVGIKAASLYNHISSKQDILKDLLMHIANSFVDGITEIDYASPGRIDSSSRLGDVINSRTRTRTSTMDTAVETGFSNL